jgi:mono/diheme cytochrome c family protein
MESNLMLTNKRLVPLVLAFLLASAGGKFAAAADGKLQFNSDIRPILVENCFACHGADSAARKADLRLDKRDAAVEYGAIDPGKPASSVLVERIFSDDADVVMPPPATKKKLTAAQRDKLKQWIAEGAEYQPHWSFIPPTRPAPPAVKDKAWGKSPIDAFVLAKLEAAGLAPAAEADRRTLARRLSLDLTGLPPEPSLVEQFVNDKDATAYEKLVDRLMESKHWGEHRGRYWLDAARYADTHGIHFDNYREIWAYRDWVIAAFNRNMPFDQFTIEQLAGDLLPNASLEQKIATGFVRCNITTNEGGIIDEEYAVLYARDRTETFGHVFLGMTAGCAVCHDHKFDPLSTKDFYSLSAFFNNTTQAVKDGNIKDTPPVVVVPTTADRPRWDSLQSDVAALRGQLDSRKRDAQPEFDRWLASVKTDDLKEFIPHAGLRLRAPLAEGKGKTVTISVDGEEREITRDEAISWAAGREEKQKVLSLQTSPAIEIPDAGDFEAGQGFTTSIWVKLDRNNQTGAIVARMDNGNHSRGWDLWLEGDKVGTHIVNKWPDDALKVVAQTPLVRTKWTHVCMTYDGSMKASGVKIYFNGKPQPVSVKADQLKGTIRTAVPFKIGQRSTDQKLQFMTVSDLRLFSRGLSALEASQLALGDEIEQIVAKEAGKRSVEEKTKANDWWLTAVDAGSREIDAQIRTLQEEEAQLKARGTVAHVMNERAEEPVAYVLYRGEYDQRRDPVKALTPAALPAMPEQLPDNRLGLAQWLLRPEHPLTARVTVNRFWQELFGTGIVRTSGDFGVTGELPSHPELLDWLAVEFRESGWDMKKFFKLLVTSNTYRQAATITPEKKLKDADNRLLSRGARFRMDAEMIRDYALAASGLLVPKIGGPSVKPYQPEGVWEAVAMIGSNTRDYKPDSGENLYRRSMYTFWKRAAPPASMEILNAPNRETCAVRRERTDTPLQALVTLNDVQFVEAARHLAERVVKKNEKDEDRLSDLAQRVLARPFRAEELPIVKASLAELVAHYQAQAEDAKQLIAVGESKGDASVDPSLLAAWTMLANELLNLDEVLNK